jgi:hypothetical protein
LTHGSAPHEIQDRKHNYDQDDDANDSKPSEGSDHVTSLHRHELPGQALVQSQPGDDASPISAAPMFPSRRSSFVVPGIGTIHGRRASNQASAIWASEDLAEIDRVASEIRVERARYSDYLEQMTSR